jgi:hypothetical protein
MRELLSLLEFLFLIVCYTCNLVRTVIVAVLSQMLSQPQLG